ncbi:unnamed protein product [Auanema sp. JU1783]|nr:unnamed protein product [Auanema sp. JU1783]
MQQESPEHQLRTVANILYYIREGYYGTASNYCNVKGQPRSDLEHEMTVLKGVAYILNGKVAEALRVLESVKEGSCGLAARHALIAAHQLAVNPDKQSIIELENDIREVSKKAPDNGVLCAGEVLYLLSQSQKAKTVMEKLIEFENNYPESRKNPKLLSLLAWIDLALNKEQRSTKQQFELAAHLGFPDGLVGLSRLCEVHKSSAEMKAVTKEMIGSFTTFLPGHIERAKAGLIEHDWEALITALQNSTMALDGENAYISYLNMLYAVCSSESKIDAALQELRTALDTTEKDNHKLYHRISSTLIRCCVRNKPVLVFSKQLLSKAIQLHGSESYMVEELRLAIAMEDVKEVANIAKDLIRSGNTDPFALLGMAISFLMSGKVAEAAEQVEFAQQSYPNLIASPVLHFVNGVIAKEKLKNVEMFRKNISDAMTVHKTSLQHVLYGIDYIHDFDADLLFMIALQLLDYAPIVPTKNPDDILKLLETVLQQIVDCFPGLSHVVYTLARVMYLKSETENAEQILKMCLKRNETVAETYLLRAQMLIDKGQIAEADACLTTGLNFNFAVRESSLYHLIKAKVFQVKI